MTEKEWIYLIRHLNYTIFAYCPCNSSLWFGYLLAPLSFGASLLLPNLCISDAKANLKLAIDRQNRLKLKEKGLQMSYI